MSHPDLEGPYALGCFGSQVTFYRQQCRAFNLIWALFQTRRLEPGNSVAVVGGGLAGMTASAAAASKGCRVTMFEKTEQLMSLQRDNRTRYIHAGLNDWPLVTLTDTISTDLPFLNWYASDTATVFREVEREWSKFEVQSRMGREVTDVVRRGRKFLVTVNPTFGIEEFDRVILALGFGEERTLAPLPFRSYWEDDSLHQGASRRGRSVSCLVSGCGDGGLIDALRLCLRDFNHRRFLHQLVQRPGVQAIEKKLLEIDEQAVKVDQDESAIYLLTAYNGLNLDEDLINWMKEQVRPEVTVTLHDRQHGPLGINSSRINRLSIFLLIKLKKLRYHRGEITTTYLSDGRVRVIIQHATQRPIEMDCDLVIVRHGPEPIVGQLLGKDAVEALRVLARADDPTGHPHWHPEFYEPGESRSRTRAIADYIRRKGLLGEPNREFAILPLLLPGVRAMQDDLIFGAATRLSRLADDGDEDARAAAESSDTSMMRDVLKREATRTCLDYVKLLNQIAKLAMLQGQDVEAWAGTEEALTLVPNDRDAINLQGHIHLNRGEVDAGAERFQRVLELAGGGSTEDRVWRLKAYNNLGYVDLIRGKLDDAARGFHAALEAITVTDDPILRTLVESNLGYIAVCREEYDEALAMLRPILEVERKIGSHAGIGRVTDNIGLALLGKGRKEPGDSAARTSLLDEARDSFTSAREAFARLQDWREHASCEDHLGDVAEAIGQAELAREHWTNALSVFDKLGPPSAAEKVKLKLKSPETPKRKKRAQARAKKRA
jgi:tetratricopeptide (TPR) repeat protein